MDISGYIANLSMASSQAQLHQSVGVAIAKKSMDIADVQADALAQMMASAPPPPSFGHVMDIRV